MFGLDARLVHGHLVKISVSGAAADQLHEPRSAHNLVHSLGLVLVRIAAAHSEQADHAESVQEVHEGGGHANAQQTQVQLVDEGRGATLHAHAAVHVVYHVIETHQDEVDHGAR